MLPLPMSQFIAAAARSFQRLVVWRTLRSWWWVWVTFRIRRVKGIKRSVYVKKAECDHTLVGSVKERVVLINMLSFTGHPPSHGAVLLRWGSGPGWLCGCGLYCPGKEKVVLDLLLLQKINDGMVVLGLVFRKSASINYCNLRYFIKNIFVF